MLKSIKQNKFIWSKIRRTYFLIEPTLKLANRLILKRNISLPDKIPEICTKKVLIIGVIVAGKKNYSDKIIKELNGSHHNVEQVWFSILGETKSKYKNVEIINSEKLARNLLINKALCSRNADEYDYIVICDDDILLPFKFLDKYLMAAEHFDFSISQPARTKNSYRSHDIVYECREYIARETRFVEIGPMVFFRKDIFNKVFPLEAFPSMGWGHDYVWPVKVRQINKKMGIIDILPVDHSLRKPSATYSATTAYQEMKEYLSNNDHISPADAEKVVTYHN